MDSHRSFRKSRQQPQAQSTRRTSNSNVSSSDKKKLNKSYYAREMILLGIWLIVLLVTIRVL